MKKLLALLLIIPLLFSCEGEMGPPGQDGLDGISILGQVFEAQVDFNTGNDFQVLVDFPSQIEVYDTDVVLAYILAGTDNGVDIWEPLPQTLFFNEGILLYGYNHTYADIEFFLDGTVSFEDLIPELTQDIIFRIAILPADAAQSLDLNNLESVMSALQNQEIIKLN
ncbi:MAG: hypothetical protein ABFR05_08850, partial [Bacteroidota bacterium]